MTVYAFLLAIVHIPGVTAASTLAGWSFLSLTLPFLLLRKLQMTPGHWFGVIFLAYAAASLSWTSNALDGIETLWHWGLIGGAFCLGHRLKDLRSIFMGLGLGLAISVLIGAFQLAGFHPVSSNAIWPQVSGLFYNPVVLSETAAIVLTGLIVYRLWWLAAIAAIALVMGEGRAAMLAFLMSAIGCFVPAKYRFTGIMAGAAVLFAIMTLKSGIKSAPVRWEVIELAFAGGIPLFGDGVGSFGIETADMWFEHMHNDFLEAVYEFGIGASPLFGIFLSAVSRDGPGRPVLFCFAVIACFSFPMELPVSAFVAAVVAGHLHRHRIMVWNSVAVRRRHIHDSLGGWGYWSDGDRGQDVSLQSPSAQRTGPLRVAG